MLKECFLIAPGINSSELLRSLVARGKPQFATRIVTPVELARLMLARQGHAFGARLLTMAEAEAHFFASMPEIAYFPGESLPDAQAIFAALCTLRHLFPANEEAGVLQLLAQSPFKRKGEALSRIYKDYVAYCTNEQCMDGIMLLRLAIEQCSAAPEAAWIVLEEAQLTPLEEHLVDALSGGHTKEQSISSLLGLQPATLQIGGITAAYGASNEVEGILKDILGRGLPLDHCVVAVANGAEYAQQFYDLARQYDLPVTFGCGVPIANTNPAKLLRLLYRWENEKYNGRDALRAILYSEAFDRAEFLERVLQPDAPLEKIVQLAGDLRLSTDAHRNRMRIERLRRLHDAEQSTYREEQLLLAGAEQVFQELSKGYLHILRTYTRLRPADSHPGKLDRSAIQVIGNMLGAFEQVLTREQFGDIILPLLEKTVSSENSREGYLHICSIADARAVLREHLFIAGLNAANFPGNAREDPVLLDADYAPLTAELGEDRLPLSENRVRAATRALWQLADLHAALQQPIYLSYANYTLAELKEETPSSALYELFLRAHPGASFADIDRALQHAGFFEAAFSALHLEGKGYLAGRRTVAEPCKEELPKMELAKWRISPSDIEPFLACPYRFLLGGLLHIRPYEPDNALEWMDAKQRGIFVHALMANQHHEGREAFQARVEAQLTYWRARRIPAADVRVDCEEFLQMLLLAYDQDPGNAVISTEQSYEALHASGLLLKGVPDRVEQGADGQHIVVDYKTSKRIQHVENDTKSCLQALLYAFILEKNGFAVSHCEYRYLQAGQIIRCTYDAQRKQELDVVLQGIATAMTTGDFPKTQDEENCRYCPHIALCGGAV